MRYFTTKGRLRRLHYFFHNIGLTLFMTGAIAVVVKITDPILYWPAFFVAVAVYAWPQSNVMTQRLHDSDRSARWQLVYWVPMAAMMVIQFWASAQGSTPDTNVMIEKITNGLAVLTNLTIWIPKGTKGPNQYGPDPLPDNVTVPANA